MFDEVDCQQTPCPNPSAVRCDVQRGVRPKVKEHKWERESIIGFWVFVFSAQGGGGQTIIDPGGGCGRGATCVDFERYGTTTNRTGARSGPKALLSFLCFLSFFLSLLPDGGAKKAKKREEEESRKNATTAQRARAARQSRQLQLSAGSGNRDDLSSHGAFCWQDRAHALVPECAAVVAREG